MSIKLKAHIFALLLVLIAGAGCRRFTNPFTGERMLARAGDEVLYLSEVKGIFTPGITSEDSLTLLQNYVDMWVRKQLKIQEAERRFPDAVPDIERMVEEYRGSLLGVKLDNYYVDGRLDTTFTSKEIYDYYTEHKGDFLLDRSIVRARLVKVPDAYRQKNRLKELLRWDNEEQHQDLMQLCAKNNFELKEFSAWTDFADVADLLPANPGRTDDELLRTDGVQELRDAGTWYYLFITDRRTAGEAQPVERAQEAIRRMLANKRRSEIIRSYEDSIYMQAEQNKQIVINVE